MASKNCPKCGLISAASAIRCDCGYDFASGKVKDSYLRQKGQGFAAALPPGEQLATSYRRLGNYMIDVVLFTIISTILLFFLRDITRTSGQLMTILLVSLCYFTFEAIFQKTPGKFVTRTKVVMDDGSKPPVGAILIRTLCRFLPFEPLSGRREIWWHDRLSETRVVMDKK